MMPARAGSIGGSLDAVEFNTYLLKAFRVFGKQRFEPETLMRCGVSNFCRGPIAFRNTLAPWKGKSLFSMLKVVEPNFARNVLGVRAIDNLCLRHE